MSNESNHIGLGESNDVRFDDARDSRNESPITTGTGTFAVTTTAGVELTTGTLEHVGDGNWVGGFDASAIALVEGQRYHIDITLVSSGRKAFRRLVRQARYNS